MHRFSVVSRAGRSSPELRRVLLNHPGEVKAVVKLWKGGEGVSSSKSFNISAFQPWTSMEQPGMTSYSRKSTDLENMHNWASVYSLLQEKRLN